MQDVIRTSGLTKRYGSRAAVQDLSLRVASGEIYAFLGLNGAGKTTTIRLLLGMVHPSSGSAEILGSPVVAAAANGLWSRVGYLVETPRAYPELTVRENLEISRCLHLVNDSGAVGRAIERFGLQQHAAVRAGTLSLGNMQRLGLARALLHDPDVVILDEPANALDPAGVVEVRELLRNLATTHGVTVFMSSHVLREVARLATRIGIIHEGQLVEEFSTPELERRCQRRLVIDAPDRRAARRVLAARGFDVNVAANGMLESADPQAIAHPERISELLAREGTAPSRLCVEQEDLETYFLNTVSGFTGNVG